MGHSKAGRGDYYPRYADKVAGDLKIWDANVLGDLQKRVKNLKKELE